MGHRISRVVTRTGDKGSTGLADGSRLPKTHRRIAALGDVDELNCHIGVLLTLPLPADVRVPLRDLQSTLFNLGGELALPGAGLIGVPDIERIETLIEQFNADLPPLKEFVLPGGTPASAQAHVVRAVARRVERSLWALHAEQPLPIEVAGFANRLSDLMFVIARLLARLGSDAEPIWQRT